MFYQWKASSAIGACGASATPRVEEAGGPAHARATARPPSTADWTALVTRPRRRRVTRRPAQVTGVPLTTPRACVLLCMSKSCLNLTPQTENFHLLCNLCSTDVTYDLFSIFAECRNVSFSRYLRLYML